MNGAIATHINTSLYDGKKVASAKSTFNSAAQITAATTYHQLNAQVSSGAAHET